MQIEASACRTPRKAGGRGGRMAFWGACVVPEKFFCIYFTNCSYGIIFPVRIIFYNKRQNFLQKS